MTTLCWFRSDLRIDDQPALSAATQDSQAIALFIASPEQWRSHTDAPVKVDFWLRALHGLRQDLAKLNIPLLWLVVDHWKDVPAALLEFCLEHNIERVHCNREHGVNERRRDRACYQLLEQNSISMIGHHGGTIFVPGSVKTGSDQFYRVFTPFSKACKEKLRTAPYRIAQSPMPQSASGLPVSSPLPEQMPGWALINTDMRKAWPASSEHAHSLLREFVENRISDYRDNRDYPAIAGTSTLSPYLAAGLLSAGQCLNAAMMMNHGETSSGDQGVVTWINEILWREFYQHLLFGFPGLSMHQPMRPETNGVIWRNAPDDFAAWSEARTGVPIVDAAMRQLLSTGWMHNRLRMVVAMYLTKNLLIDWRLGEAFFMRHLVDGELAANNGGWQWSASTGADSAPYFRVFNPISQSEKFDPDGTFIRRWVPELSNLDKRDIHNPSDLLRKQLNYPQQIVDLKSSRLRAIAAFSGLKNEHLSSNTYN